MMMRPITKANFLIFTILLLIIPFVFSSEVEVWTHYEGQNPLDGVRCSGDNLNSCSNSFCGDIHYDPSDRRCIISNPVIGEVSQGSCADVSCNDKPCEEETNYYYTAFAYSTIGDDKTFSYLAYTVDYDSIDWTCSCKGQWEPLADNGAGECCGDDPVGNNHLGINTDEGGDDPDMGKLSCEGGCPLGQFDYQPGLRHWSLYPDYTPTDNLCCGDDTQDCGASFVSEGKLVSICSDIPGTISVTHSQSGSTQCTDPFGNSVPCAQGDPTVTMEQGPWGWVYAAAYPAGIIWESPCADPDISYLSTGEEWITCAPDILAPTNKRFNIIDYYNQESDEISNPYRGSLEHDYICFDEQPTPQDPLKFKIAECCGSDSTLCNNNYLDLGGENFISGDAVEIANKWFFCREDFTFGANLDCYTEDCDYEQSCEHAGIYNEQEFGYNWTGTKCCAEPEDSPEYYSDENGTGACFNSSTVRNGNFLSGLNEIASINGVLVGCNIAATNYKPDNQWLLGKIDTHTGEPLIKEVDFCTVEEDIYCDYSEEWKPTWVPELGRQVNRTNLVYVPPEWGSPDIIEAGCCESTECWNGSVCYLNQANFQPPMTASHSPRGDGYRCSDGQWIYSELKVGLDGQEGYCPRNNQCLVKRSGNYEDNNDPEADPQCIGDSQYIGDDYCENGNWSSRTKLLALTLLSTVNPSEDYILYCSPYDDVLNYFDYTADNIFVKNLFLDNAVNNLCLLDYDNKLILATSLNSPLNESAADIARILPQFENCDLTNGHGFVSCNSQQKAWFNKELKSIVYSKDSFQLAQDPPFVTTFNNFIKTPMNNLANTLKSSTRTTHLSYRFFNNNLKLDKLYVAKKGDKKIIGTFDELRLLFDDEAPLNLIARYEGALPTNINAIIDAYNKSQSPQNSIIVSVESGDSLNIISTGGIFTNIKPYEIWSDLTGKLRLE